jgi:DNA mismatch repair protein MutS
MMKQYLQIKSEYKDCILFFRLGDFYEMFFDDAVTASSVLEITLTGKDCGMKERAPMCGVPFHSAEGYIAKLVKNGYKVAICEQTEDPKMAKGIVKREVIRIVTPGTANMDSVLTSADNNFLCCVYIDDEGCGLSFVDVSTGELVTTEIEGKVYESKMLNIIACFRPSEVIVNDYGSQYAKVFYELDKKFHFYCGYIEDSRFEKTACVEALKDKFGENALEIADIDTKDRCIKSLGGLFDYLLETQKTDLSHINEIKHYVSEEYMDIDVSSRRNLELTETMRDKNKKGSLFGILDKTKTAMGTRRLKGWIDRPLLNETEINLRLDAVEELLKNIDTRSELTDCFKKISDIERITSKVVFGSCNARDLVSLRNSLSVLPEIDALLKNCSSHLLSSLSNDFDVLSDLYNLLSSAIVDEPPLTVREGGMIKPGFDAELDRLKDIVEHGADKVAAIESREREATQIKTMKVSYNKVFGYYIEVSKSQVDKVPPYYIRKQTLANCERYITQELKEVENTILGARERVNDLEYEDFCYVKDELNENLLRLKNCARIVSIADVLCSFANVASEYNYAKPSVDSSDVIDIKNGRHPIVEMCLTDSVFVPNDTYLDTNDHRFSIITGPNMAGKSTYMRQTALITLMAQIGSFVPAQECRIGIVDKIFTRVGASDDLASGQSTFMVEMSEVANILRNSTKKSLLILDEIGRGTSTFDGLSIAWSVVEYISKNIGAKSLFSTHYHELTALEDSLSGVKNYSIAVKKRGEGITFLRKIVRGGTDDSFGIEVAYLADVPYEVIGRAREILSAIEKGNGASSTDVEKINENIAKKEEYLGSLSPVIERLKNLDISTLTPLEAINELFRLQKEVRENND